MYILLINWRALVIGRYLKYSNIHSVYTTRDMRAKISKHEVVEVLGLGSRKDNTHEECHYCKIFKNYWGISLKRRRILLNKLDTVNWFGERNFFLRRNSFHWLLIFILPWKTSWYLLFLPLPLDLVQFSNPNWNASRYSGLWVSNKRIRVLLIFLFITNLVKYSITSIEFISSNK